jgi:hypothetical protein
LQGPHGGISHAGEEQHRYGHRGPEAGLEGDAAQEAHRRRRAQLPALEPQGGIGVQAGVERLRGSDFFRRSLEPDAHVARAVGQRRRRGLDPVVIAVFAPILDDPLPGVTALDGVPQIAEHLGRHVGMADDVVRLAEEFFARHAGVFAEVVIHIFCLFCRCGRRSPRRRARGILAASRVR